MSVRFLHLSERERVKFLKNICVENISIQYSGATHFHNSLMSQKYIFQENRKTLTWGQGV